MDGDARIAIGSWPTPVGRCERTSAILGVEVWAKLEEECGTWGDNKVRKLEYILGRARSDGIRRLVGFGAGTSNWTTALAFHGRNRSFEVEAVLTGEEPPASHRRLYSELGTTVRRVGPARFGLEVGWARLRPDRGSTRFLPLGGSGPEGHLGSARAGTEIANAIHSGDLPRPERTFVATGTAGTAAGIAAGSARAGIPLEVVCVRVVRWPYGTTRKVLKQMGESASRSSIGHLQGDGRFFAPGYARPNRASMEAARIAALDGLELDQTYAAKAFASLISHARAGAEGPLLFVHTSPGPAPSVG